MSSNLTPNCICLQCGVAFRVKPYRIKNNTVHFCSIRCRDIAKTTPLIDRFFFYVGRKQPSGYILWTGFVNKSGYGTIYPGCTSKRGTRNSRASRVSYELFVGPIPDGLLVLHSCDTPACISPVHLFLGTQADNMADKVSKGRQARGKRHGCGKRTEADVREIRRRYAAGDITQKQLADEFNVYQSSIGRAIDGSTWKHIA